MDGNLLTSVAIYIPPERSFGAGAALGDECAPALLIPTTTKRESTSAQGPLVEPPRVGGSALVVEDDEGVRTMVAHMLAELGFDVIQVGDGFEALTVLKEGHDELALVLLDLVMPRLSGEEVLTELEHAALTAPIILTSGFNRHEMSRRVAGRGVSGFLQKPYDFTELQATVGDVLKAAALLRAGDAAGRLTPEIGRCRAARRRRATGSRNSSSRAARRYRGKAVALGERDSNVAFPDHLRGVGAAVFGSLAHEGRTWNASVVAELARRWG